MCCSRISKESGIEKGEYAPVQSMDSASKGLTVGWNQMQPLRRSCPKSNSREPGQHAGCRLNYTSVLSCQIAGSEAVLVCGASLDRFTGLPVAGGGSPWISERLNDKVRESCPI